MNHATIKTMVEKKQNTHFKYRLALILISLCVALIATIKTGWNVVNFGDAEDYLSGARAFLSGEIFPRTSTVPYFRAPLYSFLISLLWKIFPESIALIKIIQILLYAIISIIGFELGLCFFKKSASAFVGTLFILLHPIFLQPVTDIQTETFHLFLFLSGMLILIRTQNEAQVSAGQLFVMGIFFGLASLTRPSTLYISLVVLVLSAILFRKNFDLKRLALPVIAMFLTILPWSIANQKATGSFILINDAAGYNLWLGNMPESLPLYNGTFANSEEFNRFGYNFLQREQMLKQKEKWESTVGYSQKGISEREALWKNVAIENIKNNPVIALKLFYYKTTAFLRPWLNPKSYSLKMVLVSALIMISMFGLAAMALAQFYKSQQNRRTFWIIIALFVASTGLHVLTCVCIRYRTQYIDPFLAIFAGGYLMQFMESKNFLKWKN